MQTLAIFLDAYRELNARKLFWITMILSALVVIAFAFLGITDEGLKIIVWELPIPGLSTDVISEEVFYKSLFVNFGIGFWLAWLATILALVSTAPIFPSFVSGGTIDLFLSKPMGRMRLFLTKYVSGLLFVALQVTVFSAASFFVLGFRGGTWEPAVFLAVPIVVIFFSYLFCVCVLLGLLTRSTIAALLLTLLFWCVIFAVHATEQGVLSVRALTEMQASHLERSREYWQQSLDRLQTSDDEGAEAQRAALDERINSLEVDLEESQERTQKLDRYHGFVMVLKTVLPKTAETIYLLERWMIDMAELPLPPADDDQPMLMSGAEFSPDHGELQMEIVEELRGRSALWVLATSLGFEAVVLAIAGWIFSRRDF